jgi:hypothetical protein
VRWLRADELGEVTWAEADVVFLDVMRDLPSDERIGLMAVRGHGSLCRPAPHPARRLD